MSSIISERLLYRNLTGDDVTERYCNWLNDPEVNRFLETRFSLQTLESCRKFVLKANDDPCSHLFGIFKKDEHVGNVKLGFINEKHKVGQLSLLIGKKTLWGRGYATEAIRAITQWGFDTLELERIEAGCYDTNLGSLRAFLKAGYSVEGFFRSRVVCAGSRIGSFWLGVLKHECLK